ncbi:GSCOCG00012762001-RA-CDS, partial [Cotesia congregata]
NIYGLPIAKSSTSQLYPIFAQIHPKVSRPFVIGIYNGHEKPNSCKLFLEEFLNEYTNLNTTGFNYKNRHFNVVIRAVICDSPARSFVTCTKLHNGYYGCGKCREEGDYKDHRMLFLNVNAPLRTDQNFIDRIDEEHHIGQSPFEEASIGMASQFPIDYIHNCCLGVMKKILVTFVKGPHAHKWSAKQIEKISEQLVEIAK